MEIGVVCSEIHVHVLHVPRTSTRKAHGPDVFLYGSSEFDVQGGVVGVLRLGCKDVHSVFKGPIRFKLPLASKVVDAIISDKQYTLDPNSVLGFRSVMRHFDSDGNPGHREEVRHAFGYGFVNFSQLATGYAKGELIDFPAKAEEDWAIKDNSNTEVLQMARQYMSSHKVNFSYRGYVEFKGVSLEVPQGLLIVPINTSIAQATDMPLLSVAYTRPDEAGRNAKALIHSTFMNFIDKVLFASHGGKGDLKGYAPFSKTYVAFVASYDTETGARVPAPLALMSMLRKDKIDERLLYHLIAGQLNLHGVTKEEFISDIRHVLNMYSEWKNRVDVESTITHRQEKCIGLVVSALCSISNSIAYTSDVAEIDQKEIITEQLVMRLWEDRAGDCEDVIVLVQGLWVVLVTNKNDWTTELVRLAAFVMDLYSMNINSTMSGECHIMGTLTVRERLFHQLVTGYNITASGLSHDNKSRVARMSAIAETVLWPERMYMENGSRQVSTDHCFDELNRPRYPQFLPAVLYAEGTRVSPVNHKDQDCIPCSDRQHHLSSVTRKHAGIRIAQSMDSRMAAAFQALEPAVPPAPDGSSRFYEGFICMYFLPPPVLYALKQGASMKEVNQMLRSSDFFCCGMYHDIRAPNTYGVSHMDVTNCRPHFTLLPFARLTESVMNAFTAVYKAEPPVLCPTLPTHLQSASYTQLGVWEPMPQLKRSAILTRLTRTLPIEKSITRSAVRMRFYPHDGTLQLRDLEAIVSSLGDRILAIRARRLPLVSASCNNVPASEAVQKRTIQYLQEHALDDLDVSEYASILDSVKDEDIRHHLGYLYRHRPLTLNAIDVYLS